MSKQTKEKGIKSLFEKAAIVRAQKKNTRTRARGARERQRKNRKNQISIQALSSYVGVCMFVCA